MNVSATPSDEIAAALASTMAQRLLEDVTAGSPRRRNRIAYATWPARATAPVERSEAFGSSRCNFCDMKEFEFPELDEQVPKRYHGFAAALLTTDRKPHLPERLRNFWRSPAAMQEDMIAEGISEKVRGDFLHFAAAHAEAVDGYLTGRLNLAEAVGDCENPAPPGAGLERIVFHASRNSLQLQRVASASDEVAAALA